MRKHILMCLQIIIKIMWLSCSICYLLGIKLNILYILTCLNFICYQEMNFCCWEIIFRNDNNDVDEN